MSDTVLVAIITAIGTIIAALLGRKGQDKAESPPSNKKKRRR